MSSRPDHHRKLVVNEGYFSTIDTPDKAYWLGLLTTDGNVSGTRICINLIDREHLVLLAKTLGISESSIRKHQKKTKDKVYSIYRLQFRSKQMVQDLDRLGVCPQKTFAIVPWIGPAHLMPHYWRGCLDGDGCISASRSRIPVRYSVSFCGNRQMVDGWVAFVRTTIGSNLSVKPIKKIFYAQTAAIEDVRALCTALYQVAGPSLARKLALAQQAIVARAPMGYSERRMGRSKTAKVLAPNPS